MGVGPSLALQPSSQYVRQILDPETSAKLVLNPGGQETPSKAAP